MPVFNVCLFISKKFNETERLYVLVPLYYLQSNFNSSNTDSSFTMANKNSFLDPTIFFSID